VKYFDKNIIGKKYRIRAETAENKILLLESDNKELKKIISEQKKSPMLESKPKNDLPIVFLVINQ